MTRPPSRSTSVKVCCIADSTEAALAIRYGADALGLVSAMPSGPGVIDDDAIAKIAAGVPRGTATFLLTSRTDPDKIVEQQRRMGTDTLQLVDRVAPDDLERIRTALPAVSLVQVIHVRSDAAVEEAVEIAPLVDMILLDSGNPDAAIRELGGTGRTHDWELSRRIVECVPCPVYLAGGLDPDNVGTAIETVGPYGVDLCSGLRVDGKLDEPKLARFMEVVRAGCQPLS